MDLLIGISHPGETRVLGRQNECGTANGTRNTLVFTRAPSHRNSPEFIPVIICKGRRGSPITPAVTPSQTSTATCLLGIADSPSNRFTGAPSHRNNTEFLEDQAKTESAPPREGRASSVRPSSVQMPQ